MSSPYFPNVRVQSKLGWRWLDIPCSPQVSDGDQQLQGYKSFTQPLSRGGWIKGLPTADQRALADSRLSHSESQLSLPTTHSFIHMSIRCGHNPGVSLASCKCVGYSACLRQGSGIYKELEYGFLGQEPSPAWQIYDYC